MREQRERVAPAQLSAYKYDAEIAIRWNEMASAAKHFRRTTSREQKCERLTPSRPVIGSVWPPPNELPARHATLGVTTIDTIRIYPCSLAS